MPASTASDAILTDALRAALRDAQAQVNTLVLGKPQQVRLAFVALLADGHLLIEDLPGLGKTTLAHAMAATLGLGFQRVQFTSVWSPLDLTIVPANSSVLPVGNSRRVWSPAHGIMMYDPNVMRVVAGLLKG